MRTKSYAEKAEGGLPMWEDCKAKSLAIVRVVTDDAEFSLAHLMRDGDRDIRIATYGPTRPGNRDTHETGRRYKAQIFAIDKRRIRELARLG